MRIDRVELWAVRLPLRKAFTTSSHTKGYLDHILVRVTDQNGAQGWGECASPSAPYYCAETLETCWHVLRDFLVPLVSRRRWSRPEEVSDYWHAIRGNAFAKAGLEMACWDLYARSVGISIASLIGGTQATIRSGVSIGIQENAHELIDEVRRAVDAGYHRVKIKVGPDRDLQYLAAVRDEFPTLPLLADANSAYRRDDPDHVRSLQALDKLGLMMIEQPLADDDIVDHAWLQSQLRTPICLDESIRSSEDARKALDLDSCRVVNIKVSRLGGLREAVRVHDICAARGVPVWCGGMHEFGIGRAANVAVNSMPGFTLPGDIAGSDHSYTQDIVTPPIRAERGCIRVSFDQPGLGVTPVLDEIERRTLRRWVS